MTITTTLKKFEDLKAAILKDSKVDSDEAAVLLDFIAPYARSGNLAFSKLYKAIVKAQNDNVITQEESDDLVNKINTVSEFLKHEKKIETVLAWIGGIAMIAFILYYVI